MTVKERLIEFIKAENLSQNEFCQQINVGKTFISSMRKGTTPANLLNIVERFPALNLYWLLLGQGEMYIEETPKPKSDDLGLLISYLKDKDDKIETLIEEKIEYKVKYERLLLEQKKTNAQEGGNVIYADAK